MTADAQNPQIDLVYVQGDAYRRVTELTEEQVTYLTKRGFRKTTPRTQWVKWAVKARRCRDYEVPPEMRT
jgi:hypothetical protein